MQQQQQDVSESDAAHHEQELENANLKISYLSQQLSQVLILTLNWSNLT